MPAGPGIYIAAVAAENSFGLKAAHLKLIGHGGQPVGIRVPRQELLLVLHHIDHLHFLQRRRFQAGG